MKRVKRSLLIIVTMLFMLSINLISTDHEDPLRRIDGSVRVENVGISPYYKSSRLKLQKLNYINESSEINSVDFQDANAVAVFSEEINLLTEVNEEISLSKDINEETNLSKDVNLVENSIEHLKSNGAESSIETLNSDRAEYVSAIKTVPNKMVVNTGNNVLGSIGYEDFYLIANKITTNVGPAYCLEVEKEYPNGEMFEFEGKPERNIIGMMAAGYPNKSAEELGLDSDDAAYFATQMAIWSVTEGYIPKKFKSSHKSMLQAIKNIYEEGIQYAGEDIGYIAMEYYYSDSVQRIVAYVLEREEVTPPSEEVPVKPGETEDTSNDLEEWPDTPDDEEVIETPSQEEGEGVFVNGLG